MRTIVHISDLHFGRSNENLLSPLRAAIVDAAPHLLVVSGDLTQRAKTDEFDQARRFLDSLPKPQLVVPGNHDVPLYNVLNRWLRGFQKYQAAITADLEPFYGDEEIAVVGLNSARALTLKNGRLNRRQIERASARLAACGERVTRIVVTHHPFQIPNPSSPHSRIGRASLAMSTFAHMRVDLVLSGHLHTSHVGESGVDYAIPGYSALLILAGTATSTRQRDEVNAFNIITIDDKTVTVHCLTFDHQAAAFARFRTDHFRSAQGRWQSSRDEEASRA